ncbi:MAG: hypothetical protein HY320_01890 [Armatimonadetes bacterium]|nr:hypothetical protein [Armatimonadota bacterium]
MFGLWDVPLALATLAAAVALCWPTAAALRHRAAAKRMELQVGLARLRDLKQLAEFQQRRQQDVMRLRRTAERLAAGIDSRPATPWPTAISEISRNRPGGVYARRIIAYGPNFKMLVSAARPDLVVEYAQRLGMSPFIRQVTPPAGGTRDGGSGESGKVIRLHGSFAGE